MKTLLRGIGIMFCALLVQPALFTSCIPCGGFGKVIDHNIMGQEVIKNENAEGNWSFEVTFNSTPTTASNDVAPSAPGMISASYACSPAEPIILEMLESVVITSDTDIDVAYPSGTDLSAIFNVYLHDPECPMTLPIYLRVHEASLKFEPTGSPQPTGPHVFTIISNFEGGISFTDSLNVTFPLTALQ